MACVLVGLAAACLNTKGAVKNISTKSLTSDSEATALLRSSWCTRQPVYLRPGGDKLLRGSRRTVHFQAFPRDIEEHLRPTIPVVESRCQPV